jgi:hypothetical protein
MKTINLFLLSTICYLTSSCASTNANMVSAVSSDNLSWPFCVDVISTNLLGVVTLEGMLCANATVELAKLQAQYAALKPSAAFGPVKQVPPSEIPVPKSGL